MILCEAWTCAQMHTAGMTYKSGLHTVVRATAADDTVSLLVDMLGVVVLDQRPTSGRGNSSWHSSPFG